jgi:hypothetical protein
MAYVEPPTRGNLDRFFSFGGSTGRVIYFRKEYLVIVCSLIFMICTVCGQ